MRRRACPRAVRHRSVLIKSPPGKGSQFGRELPEVVENEFTRFLEGIFLPGLADRCPNIPPGQFFLPKALRLDLEIFAEGREGGFHGSKHGFQRWACLLYTSPS